MIYASQFDVSHTVHRAINLLSVSKALIFIAPRILHLIITIETIWKRNHHEIILDQLHEIDGIFEKNLYLQLNCHGLKQSIRKYFLKWIAIIPILIITDFYIWNVYGLIYVVLLDYSYIKLILNGSQYSTYAILVWHRIEAMHEALDHNLMQVLQELEFESAFVVVGQRSDDNETFQRQFLINLRQISNKIYETIELMNATFKWSISLNISVDKFTVAMVSFGHLQCILDSKYENNTIVNFCGLAIYTSYYVHRLALLISISNSVAESANLVAAKTHQISLSRVVTDELKDLVRKTTNKMHDFNLIPSIGGSNFRCSNFLYNKSTRKSISSCSVLYRLITGLLS